MSAEKDIQAPVDGTLPSKEPIQNESAPTVGQGTELSGLRLAAVFAVLCLAVFLVALVGEHGVTRKLDVPG